MPVACCTGGTGEMSGSGWRKVGGEMMENVNGKSVSFLAVWHVSLVMI